MADAAARLSNNPREAVPASGGLRSFLRDLPAGKGTQRFWLLVAATGFLSGIGAAGLQKILELAVEFGWRGHGAFLDVVRAASGERRFLVPLAGGLLVVAVSLLAGAPLRGHGTASILESIWVRSGRLAFLRALLRGAVTIIVVACGAPLGREGALLQTGAAVGSALALRFRVTPAQTRLLVACGAASGVAAAYNVPIGAALFGLEVFLGSLALELFGPIVLACVVATLTSRTLLGGAPSYVIPHYAMGTTAELALAVGVGILVGAGSALYVRVVDLFATVLERTRTWLGYLLPVLAMAGMGLVAQFLPELLGNGYDPVNQALQGVLPLAMLLLLPFAKMVATAGAAGAGVPGGMFTASMFYGALLGGAFGALVHLIWPGSPSPGAFAMLGMGAVLAGTTHASISAVLILFELTGDYDMILPLMLACVVSAAVSRAIEPASLYTAVLRRRNVHLHVGAAPEWIREGRVADLLETGAATVRPHATLEEVIIRVLELGRGENLYVCAEGGELLGLITVEEIKGHLPHHRLLASSLASELMVTVHPLRPEASISEAARAFSQTNLEELPVADAQGVLLGTIRKSAVLSQGRF